MRKTLTQDELLRLLQRDVTRAGSQTAWARAHGISPQHVSDMLLGRRAISARIARCLGYQLRLLFERASD